MVKFFFRRIALLAVTFWAVSVLVFSLSRAVGDPRIMYLQQGSTQEMWDAWGREFGLDKPLPVQYLVWAGKALRGDLGISLWERRSVTEAIAERFPATLQLGLSTFIFSMIGLPLGVLSAVRRGSVWDYLGRTFAVLGQALPPFWIGLILILIFSVQLEWLPAGKKDSVASFIMPTITLGWLSAAGILRLVRSSMLTTLDEEYIKMARAKGVSRQAIIWKHALKNAFAAPLAFAGLLLGGLFTGAIVTESVFGWPGIGRLAIQAVLQNDFPMLAGVILLFTLLYVLANLAVDVIHASLDPRVRF